MADLPAGRTGAGRFAPGHSGNPAGRQREEFSFNGIFRAALAQRNRSGKSVGERLVARYIKLGLAGNTAALEAIVARIDGKPAQSLTLKGDTDAPLHVRHSARLEAPPKPELMQAGTLHIEPAPDPDETDTAHHLFVPSEPDAALCNQCGEAKNWHGDTDHHDPDSTE